ncbi:cell division protein ZipA [Vibrio sp. LaRot3]|uniref:cell division protein ZipA n=1 Tax=Vibrio sp. LaRot3 TaxID=2998829 RepID=UPI0022CDED81|nr:cell division protein ZipA [Vibrio sp. LaRot3]MDA0146910.1 cell division protein ZipA [Vibrio sp. LaRot3]
MPELRIVLIGVGALAIVALLFHGLWTSKKEGKSKFGDKPLGTLDVDNDEVFDRSSERGFAPEDDFEIIRKERKEPEFVEPEITSDPLIDDYQEPSSQAPAEKNDEVEEEIDIPSFSSLDEPEAPLDEISVNSTIAEIEQADSVEATAPVVEEPDSEPELEVIVLNVHCSGEDAFIGTKLFDSMQQNGLLYGEMDIFHRHADLSGTGKVLFSVANMMQPGTLKHDDPAEFTTKGISFFMTLPCFGDAEQNFKLMLKTAQQIADDLGANVLDDARNLMTPNRLDAYRAQIQQFKAKQKS